MTTPPPQSLIDAAPSIGARPRAARAATSAKRGAPTAAGTCSSSGTAQPSSLEPAAARARRRGAARQCGDRDRGAARAADATAAARATRSLRGLESVSAAGRFQQIAGDGVEWVLDVAHNPRRGARAGREPAARACRAAGRSPCARCSPTRTLRRCWPSCATASTTWIAAATAGRAASPTRARRSRARGGHPDACRRNGHEAIDLASGMARAGDRDRRVRLVSHRGPALEWLSRTRPRDAALTSIIRRMDRSLKARLIGASVLVLLVVLVVPELLSGRKGDDTGAGADRDGQRPDPYLHHRARRGRDAGRLRRRGRVATGDTVGLAACTRDARARPAARAPDDGPGSRRTATRANVAAPRSMKPARAPEAPPRTEPAPTQSRRDESATPNRRPPAAVPSRGTWSVQVGAFGSAESARKLVQSTRGRRFPAYVSPVQRNGKTLHRVRVGPESARPRPTRWPAA